jgi:solute carrier family 25 phosphate transporter 23/24/25/41
MRAQAEAQSLEESPKIKRKDTVLHKSSTAAADMTRRMVCGGLAGMIAKTATNPLERIKMLSQTGEHGLKSAGVMSLYRSILKNEGILGLWAGNGANLLRVFPAKAVVFSSNDMYQGILRNISNTAEGQKLAPAYAFFAGGFAGMTASACTYPLDFARGRISGKLVESGKKKEYHGIIRTVIVSVKDEGFMALYKGVTPTIAGALPYEGIKFGTVGFLERTLPTEDKTSPLRKMLFGGLGGVMAGLITYPNDTIRRMLQLQGSRGTQAEVTGYWDCVQKTYKAHGVGRFYRGVIINVIRMAPNSAVQFGSYELLKQLTAEYF